MKMNGKGGSRVYSEKWMKMELSRFYFIMYFCSFLTQIGIKSNRYIHSWSNNNGKSLIIFNVLVSLSLTSLNYHSSEFTTWEWIVNGYPLQSLSTSRLIIISTTSPQDIQLNQSLSSMWENKEQHNMDITFYVACWCEEHLQNTQCDRLVVEVVVWNLLYFPKLTYFISHKAHISDADGHITSKRIEYKLRKKWN